jgi:hypothetical protein
MTLDDRTARLEPSDERAGGAQAGAEVLVGVLGGVYPAWRVTRMTPLKALSGT